MYVTSDMACSEANSATPMTAARIAAQDRRVSRTGSKFTSGNWILSNLVQTLGGIGIGNPPGTKPRPLAPDFRNAPSSDAPILPGGLYGRRLNYRVGTPTGQPQPTENGFEIPSIAAGTVQPENDPWVNASTLNAGALNTSPVEGGSSPSAGPAEGSPSSGPGYCAPLALQNLGTSEINWKPWLLGGLLLIVGFGALTGGDK